MEHLSWQSMFAADFKSKRKISVSPRLDAWDVMVIKGLGFRGFRIWGLGTRVWGWSGVRVLGFLGLGSRD